MTRQTCNGHDITLNPVMTPIYKSTRWLRRANGAFESRQRRGEIQIPCRRASLEFMPTGNSGQTLVYAPAADREVRISVQNSALQSSWGGGRPKTTAAHNDVFKIRCCC